MTASSMGWTPLFLNAEPVTTGLTWPAMVALRIAALMRLDRDLLAAEVGLHDRVVEVSAMPSSSFSRYSAAWSASSAGISSIA